MRTRAERKARRVERRAEYERVSGWNPKTRTFDKGGIAPPNAPPPPVGVDRIPDPPITSGHGQGDVTTEGDDRG